MSLVGSHQLLSDLPSYANPSPQIRSFNFLCNPIKLRRKPPKLCVVRQGAKSEQLPIRKNHHPLILHSLELLPDGNPDIAIRSATGGQKLRNIMMDCHIDLYGPNVVAGKDLLSPHTDKEKEIFNKKPKTCWLACETVVGKEDSKGEVVIQTLPEWKVHEWD